MRCEKAIARVQKCPRRLRFDLCSMFMRMSRTSVYRCLRGSQEHQTPCIESSTCQPAPFDLSDQSRRWQSLSRGNLLDHPPSPIVVDPFAIVSRFISADNLVTKSMSSNTIPEQPQPSKSLPTVSANVPVFNCVVHVLRDATGNVSARVANLPNLVSTGGTERDTLAKIVKEFKQYLRQLADTGTAIPWVDPPSPKEANEQTRFIPVHL